MQLDRGVEARLLALALADRPIFYRPIFYGLGEQRVHLADIDRLARRGAGRGDGEAFRHRDRRQRVALLRPLQRDLAQLRRVLAGDDQRAVTTVDLHAVAAAGVRNGADMHRRHRAAVEAAADQDVVGRGDVEQRVGAGVEPLLRLGRHHRRQPGEIAGDEAHRVDRVAVGDGQRVGAERGVALPGAVRRPGQHALAHQADMHRQHLADIARRDQLPQMHHRRIDPRLQADGGGEPLGLGQRRQLHRLGGRPPQRPFAIDVLARLQRRLGRLVVRRHPHDDGDRVDLRRGDHLAVIVERQPGAVSLARRLGAVGPRGAHRGQLDIGARLQRRQMGARRPGAPDAGADQAQPNLVCHVAFSPETPR